MLRMKSIVITTILAATCWLQTSEAQAGPLLDWLRGIRRTSNTQNGLFNQSSAAQSFAGQSFPGGQSCWLTAGTVHEDLQQDLQSHCGELRALHSLPNELEESAGNAIPPGYLIRSLHGLHDDLHETMHDLHLSVPARTLYDLPSSLPPRTVHRSRNDNH